MKLTDAKKATEAACKAVGSPPYFQPIEGRKLDGVWMVRAIIGTLDDIRVTVELPEYLVAF